MQTEKLRKPKTESRVNFARRACQVLFFLILTAAGLFVSSGRLDWIDAWIYVAASLAVIGVNLVILPRDLIVERGQNTEGSEGWDKTIRLFLLIPWLGTSIVAGLDDRFQGTGDLSFGIQLVGFLLFLSGNALVSWGMMANHFFSTVVRIQPDRGQTVATGGPYRFVRHPGYLGMIVYQLGTPLILGALWALIPAALTALVFVIRTILEDNALKTKLDGYTDYAQTVKYRLFPGLW